MRNSKYRIWLPSIIWGIFILTITTIPGPELPKIPLFPGADKLAHFFLYGIFGYFLTKASRISFNLITSIFFPLCIGVIFAMIDELHQKYIPGRSCDIIDFTADTLGIIIGFLLTWRIIK
ncbi:MAG: VanZ family protein [Candidatus Coatesbacteria bacterium]|nr:VanZ family protein [Candidatus Coatesbacteria bacterium]